MGFFSLEIYPFNKAFRVLNEEKEQWYILFVFSAGVGRSGTYIALDSLLQQGKALGRINVFEFVKQMREERMTMIQTLVR